MHIKCGINFKNIYDWAYIYGRINRYIDQQTDISDIFEELTYQELE